MRRKTEIRDSRTGISLLEIIVSMAILALVLVGLANVFVMSKGYIMHSRNRISASELGKQFLDPFQTYVNQSSWENPSNILSQNNSWTAPTNVSIDNMEFSAHYNVSSGPANTALRKVTVNITWDEPETLF